MYQRRTSFHRPCLEHVQVLFLVLLTAVTLSAQTNRNTQPPGSFTVPVYEKDSSRVVAVLHGRGRFDLATSKQVLTVVQVDYHDAIGATNLTVIGTNCIYDFRSKTAVSTEPLKVATGDGRLTLEGNGFIWYQTNNNLVISNNVRTVIHKRTGTPPARGAVPETVTLQADRFEFDYNANLLTYLGKVELWDPQLHLSCEKLVIRRSPANTIEEVHAAGHVVLSNRMERTVVAAENASYIVRDNEERFVLSGRPKWTDGTRMGEADLFDFDRQRDVLIAIGNAYLTLPRARHSAMPVFNLPMAPEPAELQFDPTNKVELTAQLVKIEPRSVSTAGYKFLAETNVVILDTASKSKATAERAIFGDDSTLELVGSSEWTSGGRCLSAAALSYDPKTGTFAARSNAVVRFPIAVLTRSALSNVTFLAISGGALTTNDVLKISADEIVYSGTRAVFGPSVKVTCEKENSPIAELTCDQLSVDYSGQVERLAAHGRLAFTQYPSPGKNGTITERHLTCDNGTLTFQPNGDLDQLALHGNVNIGLVQRPHGSNAPITKQLTCDSVSVLFRKGTNVVDRAYAQGKVTLRQNSRIVKADRADYTHGTDKVTLTGAPVVQLPEGIITGADQVCWERPTGKYTIAGKFASKWKRLPWPTNSFTLEGRLP